MSPQYPLKKIAINSCFIADLQIDDWMLLINFDNTYIMYSVTVGDMLQDNQYLLWTETEQKELSDNSCVLYDHVQKKLLCSGETIRGKG